MGKKKQKTKKDKASAGSSSKKLTTTRDPVKTTTMVLRSATKRAAAEKLRTKVESGELGLDDTGELVPTERRKKKAPAKPKAAPVRKTTARQRRPRVVAPPSDPDTHGLGGNARANQAFRDLVAAEPTHVITPENYLTELAASLSQNRPISFVVNIILPAKDSGDIVAVVDAIMDGAVGMDTRVAFVFGINARTAQAAELSEAWKAAETAIAGHRLPIAVLKDTFSVSKFPYGTMRNNVLQSKATADVTKALYGKGSHPYISVQDFDTASREVPSGVHVFNYFASKLAGVDPLNPWQRIPIRPLMVSGGYRLGEGTTLPEGEGAMTEDELTTHVSEDMLTREKLSEVHPLLPYSPEPNLYIDGTLLLAGGKQLAFGDGGAEFGALSKILNSRYTAELAKMGTTPPIVELEESSEVDMAEDAPPSESSTTTTTTPTTTMPNDEMALEVSETEPLTGPVPLDSYIGDPPDRSETGPDLELVPTLIKPPVRTTESFFDPTVDTDVLQDLDKTEQRSFVQGFAETVRHPVRGVPFLTDFIDGSIETDLTRIAAALETGWSEKQEAYSKHKLAQTHVPPAKAAGRIFAVRDTAEGTSLTTYGTRRVSDPVGIKMVEPPPEDEESVSEDMEAEPERDWDDVRPMKVNTDGMRLTSRDTTQVWAPPTKALKTMVGATPFLGTKVPGERGKGEPGKKYDRLSGAVSGELARPFSRIYTGIPPSQTALSLHTVALSNPTRSTIRKLEQLSGAISGSVAEGSVYDAVGKALGKNADGLRKGVIGTATAQLKQEDKSTSLSSQPLTTFLVKTPMSDGDLTVALAQHRTWVVPLPGPSRSTTSEFLTGDTERARNAYGMAMRLLANHLKCAIHVYGSDGSGPVAYAPLDFGDGATRDPVSITDRVTIDDDGQERHFYTRR
ncbi:MAG: hypothetical protein ACRDSK_11500 [Actinophytocola sp.]|uniref:hypothetical protein n=1 Tax=Actinophytocola sp. TaxID=1872138 RepID=UPI003D6C2024